MFTFSLVPVSQPGLPSSFVASLCAVLLLSAGVACSPVAQPSAPTVGATTRASEFIPVLDEDPSRGASTAPVTLVAFLDYECTFCATSHSTLQELEKHYGASQLRVVLKHFPLAFHSRARASAMASQAVFQLGGAAAHLEYEKLLFANQTSLSDDHLTAWAVQVGVPKRAFQRAFLSAEVAGTVGRDMELGASLGVEGTPHFFVNGFAIVGAQDRETFQSVIDHELDAARQLLAAGVDARELYATRVEQNVHAAWSDAEPAFRVPVGGSPSLGASEPLVTVVEFSDFECPYCVRVRPTIRRLLEAYPEDVQVVFKHNPLEFHRHAEPAARVSILAQLRGGTPSFWNVATHFFAEGGELGEGVVAAVASRAGLPEADVESAVAGENPEVEARLSADADLSIELAVRGTPHFFVNGRRLSGAQPYDEFERLTHLGLHDARQLLDSGVQRKDVQAELLRLAGEPPPPETVSLGAPPEDAPTLGPAGAPVTVQMFADFECPYCARAMLTMHDLRRAFPDDVRVVWRHLPLPFHRQARPAATVALEVLAQMGPAAFWNVSDHLFEAVEERRGLGREVLLDAAGRVGADLEAVKRAMSDRRHAPTIDRDVEDARAAGFDGTPTFAVNGYRVGGAQPVRVFAWLVRRALRESGAAEASSGPSAAP